MIERIRACRPAAYALALLLAACAFAIESWLWHSGVDRDLFVLSYGAILLSTWIGGRGAGLAATTLSSVMTVASMMSPAETMAAGLDDVLRVAVFILVAFLTSSLLDSERRALDQAARALRERRDLMTNIAHDLRSPLTVIQGNAQIVQRLMAESEESDRMRGRVSAIERASRQIASQVDELLDTARLEAGQQLDLNRGPVDLISLAKGLVLVHSDGRTNHRIELEAEAEELIGYWDESRIARVLDNLISNAVKYSPEATDIRMRAWREGAWAVLEVEDHGIGIPSADLPHIFERFHRAQNASRSLARGAGVGLASAWQIVEQHGGRITVESEEGVGSTFQVYLPLPAVEPSVLPSRELQPQHVGAR